MGAPPFVYAYLGYTYGIAGDRVDALAQLDSLKAHSPGGTVASFNLALIRLGLGDKQRAIDEIERALAGSSQMIPWLGHDSMFDVLRPEPRFQQLMKRLHFIQ
jgi:hypothetical protein